MNERRAGDEGQSGEANSQGEGWEIFGSMQDEVLDI